jgi:hypothetical protein
MPVQALAPIAIAATGDTVQIQSGMAEAKLINNGPNPLQVTIGLDTHWLDAWAADVFCLNQAQSIKYLPVTLVPQGGAAGASLLISLGDRLGAHPGVYPTAVARAVTPLEAVLVNNVLIPNSATDTRTVFPPLGTVALLLKSNGPTGNNIGTGVTYKGHTTGFVYLAATTAALLAGQSLYTAVALDDEIGGLDITVPAQFAQHPSYSLIALTQPVVLAPVTLVTGSTIDVTTRAARLLGNVTYDTTQIWTSYFASAARTVQTRGAIIPIPTNSRGIVFRLDITVASGTGGLTLRLISNGLGTSNRADVEFNLAHAPALIAVGQSFYQLYPTGPDGEIAGVAPTFIQRTVLPPWPDAGIAPSGQGVRVRVDVGDASSYTYSVDYATLT